MSSIMMRIFCGVILTALMAQTDAVRLQKLLLSVYYEAKSTVCRKFIFKQLLPAIQELHNYVELRFVPYGNADRDAFGKIECQHGPKECLSNLIQDCTLYYMRDESDVAKTEYVVCEMQTLAATREDFECVEKANVLVEDVRECMSGEKGELLQSQSRVLTESVKTNFVPTITINDVYRKKFQELGLVQLTEALHIVIQNYKSSRGVNFSLR